VTELVKRYRLADNPQFCESTALENNSWILERKRAANELAYPGALAAQQAAIIGGAKPEQVPIEAYLPYPEVYTTKKPIPIPASCFGDLTRSLPHLDDNGEIVRLLRANFARFVIG
jgi:hypothetical protein